MVVVAVVAILAIVAIPNLRDVVQNNRLNAGANELVASLQSARMEAVRLNAPASFCRSEDGTTCANDDGPWDFWVVMADTDRDGTQDLVRSSAASAGVMIANSPAIEDGTITFSPDGLARTDAGMPLQANLGVCMTSDSLPENQRLVEISAGSRFSTSRFNAPTCPDPADP